VSVKRQDLLKHFQDNGFFLLREGRKHSIYSDGTTVIPIKRHRTIDRITTSCADKPESLRSSNFDHNTPRNHEIHETHERNARLTPRLFSCHSCSSW
jgi:hypothetical protein